jgi:hypothetical protein
LRKILSLIAATGTHNRHRTNHGRFSSRADNLGEWRPGKAGAIIPVLNRRRETKMKIPAIALAVVLGAATMSAQALAGYAGASAASGTAATGVALGSAGAGLHHKMAAAMGGSSQAAPAPAETETAPSSAKPAGHPACMRGKRMSSGMRGAHSGMHCARMRGAKAAHCPCRNKDGKMMRGQCPRRKTEPENKSSASSFGITIQR